LQPYTESITGTTVTFDMVPVGGGTVTLPDSAAPDGRRTMDVQPFWIGKTEVTWDEFDVWMLGLDVEPAQRARIDAESRPSRPYGAPDRSFGHAGYGAISVTFQAAERYAEWLSGKTGRRYRLPTWAEWQLACFGNLAGDGSVPDAAPNANANPAPSADALRAAPTAALETQTWHAGNADGSTHPVASLQPGHLGLYDMLGNAAEWASNPSGEPALHGGSYRNQPDELRCYTRAEQDDSWNERDPQIPKSSWWLSDGPFAGFRIVREGDR
jgi:formylglycine-generating enzyme required for sulfatase activity